MKLPFYFGLLYLVLLAPVAKAQTENSLILLSTDRAISLYLDGDLKKKLLANPQLQKIPVAAGKFLVSILSPTGESLVKDQWMNVSPNDKVQLTYDGKTNKLSMTGSGAGSAQSLTSSVKISDDPVLNDILLKHCEATGGIEKWKAVESVKVTNTLWPGSSSDKFMDDVQKLMKKTKSTQYSSFKEKKAIVVFYTNGAPPSKYTSNNTTNFAHGYQSAQPLLALAWRTTVYKFSLEGEEDGAYKILLTSSADSTSMKTKRYAFVRKDTYLVEKFLVAYQTVDGVVSHTYTHSDFRKAGDFLIPHQQDTKIVTRTFASTNKITVDAFEVNVPEAID